MHTRRFVRHQDTLPLKKKCHLPFNSFQECKINQTFFLVFDWPNSVDEWRCVVPKTPPQSGGFIKWNDGTNCATSSASALQLIIIWFDKVKFAYQNKDYWTGAVDSQACKLTGCSPAPSELHQQKDVLMWYFVHCYNSHWCQNWKVQISQRHEFFCSVSFYCCCQYVHISDGNISKQYLQDKVVLEE